MKPEIATVLLIGISASAGLLIGLIAFGVVNLT